MPSSERQHRPQQFVRRNKHFASGVYGHKKPLLQSAIDFPSLPRVEQAVKGEHLSFLEHALAWAEAGFYCFPCKPGAKKPITPNGVHDATTDPNQIREWWTANPDANIAVAPARSGCYAVDVDPPLGLASLETLITEHGALPATLAVRTPRGGLHYWFQGDCPSSVQKLGPKLDTRGRGGYVLVPPSIVNGAAYETIVDAEIAEGPAWIPALLATANETPAASADGFQLDLDENKERAVALLRSYVDAGRVAAEGFGGDDLTYKIACEVLNLGLSPAGALSLMLSEWNGHCEPPWTADDLAGKIENAQLYCQNDIGAWAAPAVIETFNHLAKHAETPSGELPRFWPRDEAEQDARPEPTWLIPDLIPEQATVMMYGPSGHYKSFLALDMALTLAAAVPGWGTTPAAVPVVYVAAEGARAIERLRRPAWKQANNVAHPVQFWTIDTMPLVARANEVTELCATIARRGIKPRLLVLDTLARAMAGKNENDAKDAGELIEAIETIKRSLECTVLVLHHTGKEEVRGARGSSALFAGFDTVLEVKSDRERKLAVVRVRKQKDADEATAPWAFQGEVCGSSLVFRQLDAGAYQTLARQSDAFDQVRVCKALRELLPVGGGNGVTTRILAAHMCPPLAVESAEERERAISSFAHTLTELAKGRLRAYTVRGGRDLKWISPDLDGV